MFRRNIKDFLEKALKRSPVVLLNGARQVGKTTLSLELFKEKDYNYLTFDDEITYLSAKSNVSTFVSELKKPVIIDEVQRLPEIFLAIKKDVDQKREPGKYLLTGSANPLLIPRMGDSLVGRMEVVDLMPLSQGEIEGVKEKFIDVIFSSEKIIIKKKLTKEDLYKKILIGGYPSVQTLDDEDRYAWMRNYISLMLQKDVKDLAQVEKLTEFPNILKVLASRVSNLLNVANLSRELNIVAKTLHRYISLLEAVFLIHLQPSWSNNFGMRYTKTPKLYLIDSGLLSYLLDISLERALKDNILMGSIVENFVLNQLRKQITWSKKHINMYHFRTSDGQEVDIILEDNAGNVIAIEVKSSEKISESDFKGIKYLRSKMKNKFLKGFILYTGSQYLPFDKDLFVLPINALWNLETG